jgi:hypothetical protein
MEEGRPPLVPSREKAAVAVLLLATFALRAIRPDQPIVENYVGRQVPTAMVARNLERGSGFLRPRLDTAPSPNLFLVEPPLFAMAAVGLRRATGLPLEPSGRLASALAMVLAGWGLHGLARRREGVGVALIALAAFAVFPVTIRYGRAFQPDALMLGALVAGLRCWDEHEHGRGWAWLGVGVVLIATALAVKVVAAYVLIPLVVAILRPRRPRMVVLAVATLVPALLWYAHAAALLAEGGGSRASADNGAIWLGILVPSALPRAGAVSSIAWTLAVRTFTPLGFGLAVWGLLRERGGDRLWWVWGGSALAALALLAGKLHHAYYWMAVAPVAAVGVGKGLMALSRRGAAPAWAAGCGLVVLSLIQASSTWRTPPEWSSLPEAARAVRSHVAEGAWLVAPEALLFAADRTGCRLEFTRSSAVRAAGEWGEGLTSEGPLALVEFYRSRGARFVADVAAGGDPARLALHEAIRRRYNVVVDRPGVLLADLSFPQEAQDGTRRLARDAPRLRPLEAEGAQDQRPDRLRLHHGPPAR